MWLCCSSLCNPEKRKSSKKSNQIDEALKEDKLKGSKEVTVLLLGTGESGKSTIVKQMKIINMNGYTREELLAFKPYIFRNVLDSMQNIIIAMRKLNIRFTNETSQKYSEVVMNFELTSTQAFPLILCEAISYLWIESGIRNLFDKLSQVNYVIDSAPYFFDEVERLACDSYTPTVMDILKARIKTTGISETKFKMGNINIRMLDVGGQRPERPKWIHAFESVTCVIFCVALSEYDQVLLEESSQNRMLESFILFESIVNSKWFVRSSIILFLNKTDIFRRKLAYSPLKRYFSDYEGGDDFESASNFLKEKFLGLNHSKLFIYPHLTCATDTKQIELVFAAVKETILAKALKETGIL